MGTTRATAILVAAAALLVAVAAAQAPVAAPGPETSTTAAGAPGPSIVAGGPAPSTTVAGGPGPSAGQDCMTYLYNLTDCLTYVAEGSNLTAPDKGCCPELAGLVESHPVCLCQLLETNTSASLGINFQKALKLPSVCAVQTPSVSLCSAFGYPVGVPTPSEAPSPPGGTSPSPEAGSPKSGASGIANVSQLLGFAIACLTTALVF
ncbi:hypothetical protein RHMOL_Rhmol13G0267500 [Rhododendron molle]|uniref:Uncharacterized protein n=1 Tax=Rhododendron molle TaxID=49168 RepID=A0ACC0LB24_RHOML|nr:hypothetical protein RHMOL_Rhmol13G0267500 [Rhododendron molle]